VQIEDRVSHYTFIISTAGEPLYLHMLGAEITLDAHFDEYVLNFTSFTALNDSDTTPFDIPSECAGKNLERSPRPLSLSLAGLVPQVCPMSPFGRCHDHLEANGQMTQQLTQEPSALLFVVKDVYVHSCATPWISNSGYFYFPG
jgi:hypothetical protein